MDAHTRLPTLPGPRMKKLLIDTTVECMERYLHTRLVKGESDSCQTARTVVRRFDPILCTLIAHQRKVLYMMQNFAPFMLFRFPFK